MGDSRSRATAGAAARTEHRRGHGVALLVVVAGERERAQVCQRRQRRQVARDQRVRAQLQALQPCARAGAHQGRVLGWVLGFATICSAEQRFLGESNMIQGTGAAIQKHPVCEDPVCDSAKVSH